MATDTLPAPVNADAQVPLDTIPISPATNGAGTTGHNVEQADNGNGNENGTARPSDDEQITIFHDKENFNVKHPLMNEWTLWFTKPPSGKACYLSAVVPCTVTDMIQGR